MRNIGKRQPITRCIVLVAAVLVSQRATPAADTFIHCRFELFVPLGLHAGSSVTRPSYGLGAAKTRANSATGAIMNWLNSGQVKGQKVSIPNGEN